MFDPNEINPLETARAGLTVRACIAMHMLASIIAAGTSAYEASDAVRAKRAVKMADALLDALNAQ